MTPPHYALPIEPWDFIAANGIGFFEGSAIAYLCRWKAKGGVADLLKAKHFVEKLIALQQPPQPQPQPTEPTSGEDQAGCVCPRVRSGKAKRVRCGVVGCRCNDDCFCDDCYRERRRAEGRFTAE